MSLLRAKYSQRKLQNTHNILPIIEEGPPTHREDQTDPVVANQYSDAIGLDRTNTRTPEANPRKDFYSTYDKESDNQGHHKSRPKHTHSEHTNESQFRKKRTIYPPSNAPEYSQDLYTSQGSHTHHPNTHSHPHNIHTHPHSTHPRPHNIHTHPHDTQTHPHSTHSHPLDTHTHPHNTHAHQHHNSSSHSQNAHGHTHTHHKGRSSGNIQNHQPELPPTPPPQPTYPPYNPRDLLMCICHSLLSVSPLYTYHYTHPLKIPLEVHSLSRFMAKHYQLPRSSKFIKVDYLCHILNFLANPHTGLPPYKDIVGVEIYLNTPVIQIEEIGSTLIVKRVHISPLHQFLIAHMDPNLQQPRPLQPPQNFAQPSRPACFYPPYTQWGDHERTQQTDPYWESHRDINVPIHTHENNKDPSRSDLEALINTPSAEQQRLIENGAEIMQLLSEPTAVETMTAKRFQSKDGTQLREICTHLTKEECCRIRQSHYPCEKVHFRRIILSHTDTSLGDCSYLDTCRHIETCKYVHYEFDKDISLNTITPTYRSNNPFEIGAVDESNNINQPAQWISCDIRKFDFSILKNLKIRVVMADPPWDIHMDLPYGTMTDNEMKSLGVNQIQTEGMLFLWVTGRAMEVARECMESWGYHRVEEILWVKTNQLQRIIRTGRTGHWLNHSKEHCLVGIKGNPKINKNLDCDVIVSEVRETSRKPDEIYRIIERMCPNCLKIELFGRHHNTRNNWITLGNQLQGNELHHPILKQKLQGQSLNVESKSDENVNTHTD